MPISTWSKSDYEFFAGVLYNTPMSETERIYLSNRFGDYFVGDNPRFDWRRWNDAIFRNKLTRHSSPLRYGGWTRKTYEMTADALSGPVRQDLYALTITLSEDTTVTLSEDTRIALISAFGAAFERDNPRFNWDKFRIAAGSPYAAGPAYRRPDVRVRSHPRRSR